MQPEERVIIMAPVGQDAVAMAGLLATEGFQPEICAGSAECAGKIPEGAGALVLTEEALELPQVSSLLEVLQTQPPWSELPLIILTSGGESRAARLLDRIAEAARSVTVLERPMNAATLLRSVQVALRSRRRQYQVRDLIEQQTRVQEQLRESEERFRTLAENIPQLAWMANEKGWLFWYNRRWFEYTGTTLEQMQGWGWQKVHHPEHVQRVTEKFQRALEGEDRWEDTFPLRGKDGQYRWFLSRAFPIRDSQGRILRWFGTNTDITELRETQEALRLAKDELGLVNAQLEKRVEERTAELRATNEQLETYVYSVAHDLRGPLRSITGFSQLLLDDHQASIPESGQYLLKRIQSSSEFMDKLLLDLLAFGRAARVEMELVPVPVQTAWDAALFQCATQIEQTRAQVQAASPLPVCRAHEATLAQCLANLLSNSLKFVAPSVQPVVRFWADDEGGWARLWLEDNGIGIPADQHERVFRVFERLHGARYPGTGIGLSIVRKGIERMGGRVGLESAPRGGTRFWIELPKAAREVHPPPPSKSPSSASPPSQD